MPYIRCTQKLINELARYRHKLSDEPETITILDEWYGYLARVERRKCCLFTHSTTLFSFFVPGLTKPDFINFQATFHKNLVSVLRDENFNPTVVDRIAPPAAQIRLLKTKSRSVLGSMNDFIFQAKVYIEMSGGLNMCDIAMLNHDLNRVPMGALAYMRPADAFTTLLNDAIDHSKSS